jgi:hypothetical protein
LPVASATNTGKLSSTDWSTFNSKQNTITLTTTGTSGAATLVGSTLNIPNYAPDLSGYVPYTGATANLNLGVFGITSGGISSSGISVSHSAGISASSGATTINGDVNGIRINPVTASSNYLSFPSSGSRTYTYPNATGTLALISDIPSLSGYIQGSGTTNYVPKFTASGTIGNSLIYDTGTRIAIGGTSATYGVLTVQSDAGQFCIQSNTTPGKQLQIGYDHVSNNSYLTSLNQGVAFTPLALQPNGGNVAIGTSSTGFNTAGLPLVVGSGTGNTGLTIFSGASSSGSIHFADAETTGAGSYAGFINYTHSTNSMQFGTTGATPTEAMRITSGGNVGIFNTLYGINNVRSDGGYGGIDFTNTGVGYQYSAKIYTFKTSAGVGEFYGFTNDYGPGTGGQLSMVAKGDGSANIGFYSGTGGERMRITGGGAVCVGTTAAVGAGLLNIKGAANVFNLISIQNDFSAGNFIYFMNSGGTAAGNIANSAGGVLYLTSSDYRLKQDFKDYNGLNLISKIKTYDYELKCDNSRMYGVKAHELQEVIPYAVNGEKDGKEMQSVDYSKIVPILVKSIQELEARIKQLENK